MSDSIDWLNNLLDLGEDWVVKDKVDNSYFKEIDIIVECAKATGICPVTKEESKIYDLQPTGCFHHLGLFENKTYINTYLPRVIKNRSEVDTIELS